MRSFKGAVCLPVGWASMFDNFSRLVQLAILRSWMHCSAACLVRALMFALWGSTASRRSRRGPAPWRACEGMVLLMCSTAFFLKTFLVLMLCPIAIVSRLCDCWSLFFLGFGFFSLFFFLFLSRPLDTGSPKPMRGVGASRSSGDSHLFCIFVFFAEQAQSWFLLRCSSHIVCFWLFGLFCEGFWVWIWW